MTYYAPLIAEPELEDSEDLSEDEAKSAEVATSRDEWLTLLVTKAKACQSFTILRHELRRRGADCFIRTLVEGDEGLKRTFVVRANWLGG